MDGSDLVCLTMGEPAGIGGELTLKAWQHRRASNRPFVVVDDPARLAALATTLGWDVPIAPVSRAAEAAGHFAAALPVLPVSRPVRASPGAPMAATAAAVIESIDRAVALVRSGEVSAIVTNPIHKAVLTRSGFAYPGHTEYLAALAGVPRPVMMLAADTLRVVPVTVHVPLAEVPGLLTRDLIVETGETAAKALRDDFGIASPRIAVAGLNPHAGEEGTIGTEDEAVVRPAVEELRAMGIAAEGPRSADTLFTVPARATYDLALCMYHDQALIPIKTLAMDDAVNVTLGLPFIRTSPDHGTAFDIAGSGRANPASLLAAIDLAARLGARKASGAGP